MNTLQGRLAREAMFVKGLIHGAQMTESMRAFTLMMKMHEGAVRKSGLDYSTHPVRVAHQLLAAGVTDDRIIAAALLHDVVEDCHVSTYDLMDDGVLSSYTISIVNAVTKIGKSSQEYYEAISRDAGSMLVKISDRLHNLSTMHGAFSEVKMLDYVYETYNYIIPMCKTLKYEFPEYANVSYIMKNQIETICEIYISLIVLEPEEEQK